MPAKITWTTVLADMIVGQELRVQKDIGRKVIAPRISREMKLKYPEREYVTDSRSEKGNMIVTRKK